MDSSSEEMFLQNIEEFVLDEDKIVTYKWLSKVLNIHVNLSKQLLYTFCSDKKRKDTVCATYLLGGRIRSTGEDHITVVGQDKYEEAKSLFDPLRSEHVYSVQKTKEAPSPSTLYTADSQPVEEKQDESSGQGAIRCNECVRRAAEELALLRVTVPPAPAPSSSVPAKSAKPTPSTNKVSPTKPKTDGKDSKGEHVSKESKAKGGLAAMFAAQSSKASTKPSTAAASSKTNGKSKTGGISNFFSKVAKQETKKEAHSDESKPEESMDTSNDNSVPEPSIPEVTKVEPKIKKSEPEPTVAKKTSSKEPEPSVAKKTSSKDSKKSNKRGREKEKKDQPKKRRRIVVQELESSDDDMFAEEEQSSSREPSPEPESQVLEAKALESEDDEDVIPPTPASKSTNGRVRRKRKVTKDKEFMDDDGYIVTQKVTEYESYSESDTECTEVKKMKEPPINGKEKESSSASNGKKNNSKATSKKGSQVNKSPVNTKSPVKNKQQSLMNFFKKKD